MKNITHRYAVLELVKVDKHKKKTGFVAIIIIVISLAGKVFGFLREMLLANYFGTSSIVDIYLMSLTIPSILFGFLPALGVGFTLIYYQITNSDRKNQFLNNLIIFSILIALACIGLTFIAPKLIVSLCAPGFSNAAKNTTIKFLKITVWAVMFNTPVQILIAYLNCKENYINSNLSNLVVSFTQAVFVIVAAKMSPIFLPIGAILPWIFQFIWLFLSARHNGYKPSLKMNGDEYIKKVIIIAAPIAISNILVDLNGFVDKVLASSLPEGRLSALNYAFTIRAIFVTIASTVIATIFYPRITEVTVGKDKQKIANMFSYMFDIVITFIIPINVICVLLGKEGIQLILMRGNFNNESLKLTLSSFVMYMLSLSIIVIRELIIRVMYANSDTKRNLYFGMLDVGINITFSLVLVRFMGHDGLAFATSIAAIFTFPLYLRELYKLIPNLDMGKMVIKVLKISLASSIMGIVVWVINKVMRTYLADTTLLVFVRVFTCFAVGSILYLIILIIVKFKEQD